MNLIKTIQKFESKKSIIIFWNSLILVSLKIRLIMFVGGAHFSY